MNAVYLLPFLDEFPPALCRLIARKAHGRVLMSVREISAVSGLPRSTVDDLSRRTTWKDVSAEQIHRFSLACGVNLMSRTSRKRQRDFWKRRRMKHLLGASDAQQRMAVKLLNVLGDRAKRRPS